MSRTLSNVRKFIKGEFSGTRLEIMNTKPATKLPDGTPINPNVVSTDSSNWSNPWLNSLNNTQLASLTVGSNVDIHAPQVFEILNEEDKTVYRYEGPSIAQEWKLLYRGERPFYRNVGRA